MTEVTKRALFKTALTVGIIAILFAIATVWPSIITYVVVVFIASFFIGIEDARTWRRR